MMINISEKINIDPAEIEFTFARSSGPGGQNVNKVSSKAMLRWNPTNSKGIPPDVLFRFLKQFANRLTNQGDMIITSERYRDQMHNQTDCIEKLSAMLLSVAEPPKKRIKTKIGYFKKVKNLESKRVHGEKKKLRQKSRLKDF